MVEITSLPLQVTLRTVVNESLSTALYVYVFMELEVTNKTIHFFFGSHFEAVAPFCCTHKRHDHYFLTGRLTGLEPVVSDDSLINPQPVFS